MQPRRPIFDVLVTTDQNIRYQENLSDRKIADAVEVLRILHGAQKRP